MLKTFNILKKYFQISLKENLNINNKIEEFDNVKKNIIVQSSKEDFGDYQSNIALILSKLYKQNPRFIAEEIIDAVKKNIEIIEIVEKFDIAGPGFINISIKKSIFIKQLRENLLCKRVGIPLFFSKDDKYINKKIIVDFSSPNIAKEMHVGHLRSTIIGDSLSRIFELRGYDVKRLNHVGDWGTQFGMLIAYLKIEFPEALSTVLNINIGDLVSFYKASKIKFDNEIEFQQQAREEVIKLQNGDEESLRAWQILCNHSRKEFNLIYEILNINIEERGESFYNQFLQDVVEELKSKKISVEDQGAQCVFLDGLTNKEGNSLPLIIQKKDGGYNYATTDLAAIKYRFSKGMKGDGAKKIIYVTDQGQANHFYGIFQVANKADWIPIGCEAIHVPFGLVHGSDGKKLKTREGKTIRLKDLLNESVRRAKKDLLSRIDKDKRNEDSQFIENTSKVIGIGAVKYADLSQNRITNYQFSFDKMLSLNGNTAPYLLYTLVRISGINRKKDFKDKNDQDYSFSFENLYEWKLLKKLLKYDEIIISIENDLMVNRLCNYLFELCQIFNRFYDQLPILKAEKETRNSRFALCSLTEKTIKLSLNLLGIETLDRM
tara:strand:+ start:955 stop:2769 length:1815 start_codon:yes stop_codon:yes gene_type:complete